MTTYFVNWETGNDESDGMTEETALASEGEARKRSYASLVQDNPPPFEVWVLVRPDDKWENAHRYLETASAEIA